MLFLLSHTHSDRAHARRQICILYIMLVEAQLGMWCAATRGLKSQTGRSILLPKARNANGPADHKETEHYLTWRESVAEMMETPRTIFSKYQ